MNRKTILTAIQLLVILLLIGWRVARKSMDGFGLQADWLFIAGIAWFLWLCIPERKKHLEGALLLITCCYLFVLYGYFQLGSSVSLFWMLIEGG